MCRLKNLFALALVLCVLLAGCFAFFIRTNLGRGFLLSTINRLAQGNGVSLRGGTLDFSTGLTNASLKDFSLCASDSCFSIGEAEIALLPFLDSISIHNACPSEFPTSHEPQAFSLEDFLARAFNEKLPTTTLHFSVSKDCRIFRGHAGSLELTRRVDSIEMRYSYDALTVHAEVSRNRNLSLEITTPPFTRPLEFSGSFAGDPLRLQGKLSGEIEALLSIFMKDQGRNLEMMVTNFGYANETIPLQDISFRVELDLHESKLCPRFFDAKIPLWNGEISTRTFSLCDNTKPQAVELSNISIEEITRRFTKDRLKVTGSVDAHALIVFQPDFEAHDGTFQVDLPGGELQYLDENEALPEIARNALKSFRYSRLEGRFSFAHQTLSAEAVLEGTGLLLNSNRPVVVNLSWEENFNNLLEALRMTQDVAQKLESQGLL